MGDPDFSIGEEIAFTLKAHAVCQDSMAGSSTAPTTPMYGSRRTLIQKLAEGFGEPKRSVVVDFDKVTGKYARAQLAEVLQFTVAGKSDHLAIQDLLGQCGCQAYYTPDPKDVSNKIIMRVMDWEARFGSPPVKEFKLFNFGKSGRLGGDFTQGGVYPILGVSTQSKQVFIRGVVNGTTRPVVDETKKEAAKVDKTNVDAAGNMPTVGPTATKGGKGSTRGPVNASIPGSASAEAGGGGTLSQTGVEEFPTQKAANTAQEMDARIKSGVQLHVDSIGIPDLEPGMIVKVAGLGKQFSGPYSILKVMHSIGESGYTTGWDGINNAGYLNAKDEETKTATKVKEMPTPLYPDPLFIAPTPQPASKAKK